MRHTHAIKRHFWSTIRMKKPSYPTFSKTFWVILIFKGSGTRYRGHLSSYGDGIRGLTILTFYDSCSLQTNVQEKYNLIMKIELLLPIEIIKLF